MTNQSMKVSVRHRMAESPALCRMDLLKVPVKGRIGR